MHWRTETRFEHLGRVAGGRLNQQFPESGLGSHKAVVSQKSGGLNQSMQPRLGVYSQEFQSPRFFAGVDLAQRYFVEIGLRIAGQGGFFREVLSQQPVSVFVGAALPRALRITEVDFHIRGHREALVFGHLQPFGPTSTSAAGTRGAYERAGSAQRRLSLCLCWAL